MTDEGPASQTSAATVADRPPPVREGSQGIAQGSEAGPTVVTPTGGGPSNATTAISSGDALAIAEVGRARTFAVVCFTITVFAGAAVAALPFQPIVTPLMLTAIGSASLATVYLVYRTSRPATYRPSLSIAIAWYIPCIAVAAAIAYAGPFSPIIGLGILGIYIIGMGSQIAAALAVYLTTVIVQAVTGMLPILGIADPGFIKADYLPTYVQILFQVLIQIVLAAAFITARASRRASLTSYEQLERAVRAVAQREALLDEARDELRRALGTGRGRFTDQTIGNFRLGELIGRGAMGEVYDAVDTRDSQPVAIKMLSLSSLGNTQHVQRFLRELQTSSAIDSPNVVRVIAVGEEPLPHLVMERLRGRDLSAILRDRRTLPPDEVVDLMRQIGAGITAANAAGIIHRDLKPQNVFLAGSTWKILDFGVSRIADAGDTLTSGQLIGTPTYMAPEQARGAEVDHRADLYAIAAIAYRTLTGHSPFAGGEVVDVVYRVVHTAPRRPSLLAKLPTDVDLVLAIGLAKRPGDRFATAAAFTDALALALEGNLPDDIRRRALAIGSAWSRTPAPIAG